MQNFTAAPDPADWAAMEAMLDRQSNRGFLWLWLFAIPLLLLGAGSLYFFFPFSNEGKEEVVWQQNNSSKNGTDHQIGTFSETSGENVNQENIESAGSVRHNTPAEETAGENTSFKNEGNDRKKDRSLKEPSADPLIAKSKKKETNRKKDGGSSNSNFSNISFLESDKFASLENNPHANFDLQFASENHAQPSFGQKLTTEEVVQNQQKVPQVPESTLSPEIPDTELSINEKVPEDDEPEKDSKPKKKVRLQMGLSAAINQSFTTPVKLMQPGFEAGFRLELVVREKFALTTGMEYTKQNYHIKKAVCDPGGYYRCPDSYTSQVKSINIPLLARLNFVRKEKWNMFARVGIINHIKLEETFDYNFTVIDTPPPPNPPPPPPPPPPATMATYGSSLLQADEAMQSLGFNNLNGDALNDFSISGKKRYHISYLVGAGIEYRYKRLALQAEVNYSLLSHKIGIQETRIHSLGLKGAVLLRLGR